MSKLIKNERKKKMMLARFMCFIMLIFMSALVLYIYAVDSVKHTEQASINGYKEDAFDKIYAQLEILRKQSYDIAKSTATAIENELREKDLNQIKMDMDSGKLNADLYDVICDNIHGKCLNGVSNYRNGIVVMTQNGIFEDFSYERASDTNTIRTWESEVKSSYNKELEEDAIHKILTHSNSIIATERINRIKSNKDKILHEKISEATFDTLKGVYMKEGIEGLKNYQFKTPAYITETGDIFGQEDIVQGVKKYNHKIIIVQEFNLYDQLMAFDDGSFYSKEDVQQIQERFSVTTVTLYILGLFYVVGIIALLFYFSGIYNRFIDNNQLDRFDRPKENIGEVTMDKERDTDKET